MPGRKIEEDVSALQHLEEARFLLWRADRGWAAGVIGPIAGPRQQIGIVKHIDPGIDRPDAIDVLDLERGRDQHDDPIGHRAP